jgi:hypothetical protein
MSRITGEARYWYVWEYGIPGVFGNAEAAQRAYLRAEREAQRAGQPLPAHLGRPDSAPPTLVSFHARSAARAYATS